MTDIIIVGAGISGLYCAYRLKKRDPSVRFLILEKERVGGRMGSVLFQGVPVAIGAGVGRKKKDKLLQELLRELDIPTTEFVSRFHYLETDVRKKLQTSWKRLLESPEQTSVSFREYATNILGEEEYKSFVFGTGYSDYENADAFETLFHYGMEDNWKEWIGIHVPWNLLLLRLIEKVGKKHIIIDPVISFTASVNTFAVNTATATYTCKKIVFATTIRAVRKLLPHPIYHEIMSQPFLRVYAKFSRSSLPLLEAAIPTTTIVGVLQKVIPINKEKGVYMIVYNDNVHATFLRGRQKDTAENRIYFSRILAKIFSLPLNSLTILSLKAFFWSEGTHYYKPLTNYISRDHFIQSAQAPQEGIFVIGEAVSRKQGWTEGALESVKQIEKQIGI